MGRYFREIPLAPETLPKHYLDVAGEAAEDVELKPAFLDLAVGAGARGRGPLCVAPL